MDERDARAEVANGARELVEHYGLGEQYRLVQEAHGRHLDSRDPRDLEDYRVPLNNLLVQLAMLALTATVITIDPKEIMNQAVVGLL